MKSFLLSGSLALHAVEEKNYERPMNLHVGTSGYSYPAWKGTFYPEKLSAKKMLNFYGEHFRTVEINSSFYSLPKASSLETWASEVPADFKFVMKAPQTITHHQRLKDSGESLSTFLDVAATLKDRLGPVLFQLPPNLNKDAPRLLSFLKLLPPGTRAAFEFRHQTWFDEDVYGLLREHHAALCVADADDDLEVPFVPTADWGYLRLRRPEWGDAALKDWVKKVQGQPWRDVFVFFKHEETGTGPVFAKRFLELANQTDKK